MFAVAGQSSEIPYSSCDVVEVKGSLAALRAPAGDNEDMHVSSVRAAVVSTSNNSSVSSEVTRLQALLATHCA